jgi:hypothetical protein
LPGYTEKSMKGMFNKVKNRNTGQRFVVSTILKSENLYETAVFATRFWFFPQSLSQPAVLVQSHSKDAAWNTHHLVTRRLTEEFPARLFQELAQN